MGRFFVAGSILFASLHRSVSRKLRCAQEKVRDNPEKMLDKSERHAYNIRVFKQSARSHLPAIAPRHGS
jgi:hypothetical protein